MILTIDDIVNILPHKHPFIMVDKVVIEQPGQRVLGTKAVTHTEACFQGHFPGRALMPGSLMIEAASQTAGFLAFQDTANHNTDANRNMIGFVTEVREFKFTGKVQPGVLLQIEAVKELKKGPFLLAKIKITVEEQLVAEGALSLYVTYHG
ncbi:MAG TPA: 3-hydroxyacyl-ACP dehydratase FabZ [Bacillota bacterium]|nr:3-hydroxyacyl-ACP dehydratase FabZ [Bacillota bacterium]